VKLVKQLAFVLGCGFASHASAGVVTDALIVEILSSEYDVYFVTVDKPVSNAAACATQTAQIKRFAIKVSSPGGRVQIATLLSAQAQQRKITIVGRGEFPQNYSAADLCNAWGDTETLNYVILK
jgi:hypothetical protein